MNKKNEKIYLSVVIPCYNEKENLERGVLDEVENYLKKQKFSWEVIISDDGSSDNSRELVEKMIKDKNGFRLLKNQHGGKPHAIWCGIQETKGEYILFDDMDQSTPIGELDKFIPYFDNFDSIVGSRGISRKSYSFLRQLGSAVFLLIRKSILLHDINDTQCGFKAFRREAVVKVFPMLQFFKTKEVVKGWKVTSYDVELLFLLEKFGFSFKEVSVKWQNEDVSMGKDRSYLKESKEMLMQILRVKLNDLKGAYDQNF